MKKSYIKRRRRVMPAPVGQELQPHPDSHLYQLQDQLNESTHSASPERPNIDPDLAVDTARQGHRDQARHPVPVDFTSYNPATPSSQEPQHLPPDHNRKRSHELDNRVRSEDAAPTASMRGYESKGPDVGREADSQEGEEEQRRKRAKRAEEKRDLDEQIRMLIARREALDEAEYAGSLD